MKAAERETREDSTLRVLRAVALAALTVLAIYLCWMLAAPFLNAFTWGFTLAVVCAPLRKWLFARLPKLPATVLIMALVIVVIAVPLTFVLRQLLQESLKAQSWILNSIQADGWRGAIAANRWLGPLWAWADQQLDLGQIAQQMAAAIANWIAPAVGHSVSVISQTGVALLAFFFFLRDEETVLTAVGRALPLSPQETERLFATDACPGARRRGSDRGNYRWGGSPQVPRPIRSKQKPNGRSLADRRWREPRLQRLPEKVEQRESS
jgi:predicted PurR-regulated permease PerM